MDRLERFVARRRRLVLATWPAAVLVSVPFASRQTEHLTEGGFETAGSGSQVVADALARDFPGMQPEDLAIVFDNRKRDQAALAAAFERVEREGFEDVEGVRLNPEALSQARAAGDRDVVVMPLIVEGGCDEAVDAAAVIPRTSRSARGAVPLHVVGPSSGPGCRSSRRRTSSGRG